MAKGLIAGPERSVALGVEELGTDEVAGASPLVQPLALSRSLGESIKDQRDLLDLLRHEMHNCTGADDVPLERLARSHSSGPSHSQCRSLRGCAARSLAYLPNWQARRAQAKWPWPDSSRGPAAPTSGASRCQAWDRCSSVLTFRLATFWLPIAPGWATFVWMERRGEI